MKIIKYKLCVKTDGGEILCGVEMPWNEENENIAKMEAHNGVYTVEDDGKPETVAEPTTDDILNAMLGVE